MGPFHVLRRAGAKKEILTLGSLEIYSDSLADILQRRLDGLPLRHAAGELRHVRNVAVVFGIENQVNKKLPSLCRARILHQRGQDRL